MGQLIKIVKNVALVLALITALIVFGNVIAGLGVWSWLTSLFVLGRQMLTMADFIIDTDTIITIFGLSITLEVAYWTFRGVMWLNRFFKK